MELKILNITNKTSKYRYRYLLNTNKYKTCIKKIDITLRLQ